MFTGSMVAIVTPFKNGSIDEGALRKLIDRQIENGTSVIVPCGTTGESATLTHQEHDRVIAITIEQVNKRVKVLAGAGSNATHEAVRLNKAAQKLGADGTLHITPYYNKPTQEGLYQHFKAVAASADIPVVLYNVPGRTAVNMLPETVARLSKIDAIVGIKEASGSLEQMKKIIEMCPKKFEILSGEDALTLDMMKLGACGAISVTANVVPKECAQQDRLVREGKIAEAESLHQKLLPLHQAMFFETNPIPVKAALAMMGLISEEYRLPLVPMGAVNRERLKKVLEGLGII
ncbi:MAG TPA: 4-hydroxy-tetrahydrodipicolinate synthase [Deltaproteobacteria bacterium]|nr:MAG: 4-hydroxy-tetrahydrodipicolinate synthase [Deltaproteobacteria bacterium GWA2_45_12]HBF14037.1 4-hydroxy-tetrahydrodipicolinate synthase [Deltaproteobacteria bacterium]